MSGVRWKHRIQFSVADNVSDDINRLLASGYFGRSRSEVAQRLFLQGLRDIVQPQSRQPMALAPRKR